MLALSRQARPFSAHRRSSSKAISATRPLAGRRVVRRAAEGGSSGSGAEPEAAAAPAAPAAPQQQPAAVPPPDAPLLKPGQGTAIVTGAISVLFGVAYLALVWVMDSRGGAMQPPPPEAFLP